MISPEYLSQLKQLHQERPTFGASGAKIVGDVMKLCRMFGTQDILDYGCGKGALREALGFPIKMYDPAIDEYSAKPEPADIVVFNDVGEHLEEIFVDDVLDDLKRVTKTAVYILIATRPAKKFLADGRNAHILLRDMEWWLEKLQKRFKIISTSQDGEREFTVIGEPV